MFVDVEKKMAAAKDEFADEVLNFVGAMICIVISLVLIVVKMNKQRREEKVPGRIVTKSPSPSPPMERQDTEPYGTTGKLTSHESGTVSRRPRRNVL